MNAEVTPNSTNILVAEDDLVSRRVLEVFLARWGYRVTSVSSGDDAWRVLTSDAAPRLAILDWMMPGMEGVEVCAKLRERKDKPYTYVMLLSSRTEKKDILQGLQAGADDYITKPFDAEELQARLFVGERILHLQDELISARDALQFQATHDPLTGIANRGEILTQVQREIARCQRTGKSIGLILADVDHFKKINDTYGHLTGDAILRGVSMRLTALLRTYDSVGRYGGEEFVILTPLSDAAGTVRVAERIRAGIEATKFDTAAGELRLTMSFGVSSRDDGHTRDTEALLQAADAALYRAKAAGRNRVELATSADFENLVLAGPPPIDARRP